jgi:hypothetical protein
VTGEFLQAGEFQAKALFSEPYPIVSTVHPVAQMERAELDQLALDALDAIAGRLSAESS